MLAIKTMQKYLLYLAILFIPLSALTNKVIPMVESNNNASPGKALDIYHKGNKGTQRSDINVALPGDSVEMTKRRFKKLFNDGTSLFFDNKFAQALPMFLELLQFDPDNSHINFYVGACYMNLPESKATAIPFLQKAIKHTTIYYEYDYRSREAPVFAYFYLAYVYRNNYKITDAIINNKIFRSFVQPENEELMAEVDREIKNLESGNVYIEMPESSKFYNKLLDSRIQYDVYIRNPEQDVNWWVNNLEGIKREKLLGSIINVAYSGKVNVYDENNRLLTLEQVKAIGNEPTLLKTKTPNPPYNDTIILIENQLNIQLVTKIRFIEEWYIDDQTLEIGKKVVGMTPLIEEYFEDNTFKGYKPLFSLYFDDKYPTVLLTNASDTTSKKNNLPLDSIIKDTATTKPVDLTVSNEYSANIKSQGVLTERIRYDVPVKNFKSESQWWIDNIELGKREDYLKQLFDMVGNGIIQSYDIFDDSLTVKKVRDLIGMNIDTVHGKTTYPPFRDTIMIVNKNAFDYDKVAKFRFLEEWYLDEPTAHILKKVVGFAPLVEVFDQDKILKGYTALFWIYFDKSYPVKITQRTVPDINKYLK